MTYEQHLSSAYWKDLRQQVFDRDDWRCVLCDSPEDLQCHHRTYERFGKEELRDCYTLCPSCHDLVTDHQRRQRYTTRDLPPVQEVASSTMVHTLGFEKKELVFEANSQ